LEMRLGGEYIKDAVHELEGLTKVFEDDLLYYDYAVALVKYYDLREPSDERLQDKAMEFFKRSYELGFNKGLHGAGLLHFERGEYDKAITLLKEYEGLLLDNTDVDVYGKLGLACFEVDDSECALRYLERAVYIEPSIDLKARYHYTMGVIYLNFDENEKVLENFQAAVLLEPEFADAIMELSRNLVIMGHETKASVLKVFLTTQSQVNDALE
ncbi:MAG: hypothetical protein KAR06_06990, partial [Deltaproteobacteria bacterium]|nr:hypothetical protein [Deltaproteobacteria bacterium]